MESVAIGGVIMKEKSLTLGYFGNKAKHVEKILQYFPSDHEKRIYIEPFVGGGGFFLNKPKHKIEKINDKDGLIINFYLCCLHDPDKLLAHIFMLPPSNKEIYKTIKELVEKAPEKLRKYFELMTPEELLCEWARETEKPDYTLGGAWWYLLRVSQAGQARRHSHLVNRKSSITNGIPDHAQAAVWWYLVKQSPNNTAKRFKYHPLQTEYTQNIPNSPQTTTLLHKIQQRLWGVEIYSEDFEIFIKRFIKNSKHAKYFIYLDPPYVTNEREYRVQFTYEDHLRLRDLLIECDNVGIKWLLSYNDHPQVKEWYKDFIINDVIFYYGSNKKYVAELLISNYDDFVDLKEKHTLFS